MEKKPHQQLYTKFQAIKEKVIEIHNSAQISTNLASTTSDTPVPEWVLHEPKKSNIIIFGLKESDDDVASIIALAGELALDLDLSTNILHLFLVGTSNSGNVRPLVVKFACLEKKMAKLLKHASQYSNKPKGNMWSAIPVALYCIWQMRWLIH